MKRRIIILIVTMLIVQECMYTGGDGLIKGERGKKMILNIINSSTVFTVLNIISINENSETPASDEVINNILISAAIGPKLFVKMTRVKDERHYEGYAIIGCISEIKALVSLISIVNIDNFKSSLETGSDYIEINPYWMSAKECKFIDPPPFYL